MRADFILLYGDVRRGTPQEVRQRLHSGEHQQKPHESIGDYAQRFRELTRDDPDISQVDLCAWFLNGMLAQLQRSCASDANGNPWAAFDALLTYAHGQESRSLIGKKTVRFGLLKGTAPAPSKQAANRGNGNRDRRRNGGDRGNSRNGGDCGHGRNGEDRGNGRSHRRTSEREKDLEAIRRENLAKSGLCYHCAAPFGKGHRCQESKRQRKDGPSGSEGAAPN
jgi:hypothetical protein